MIIIFIGIEGYTVPGDEYQLVLPAVSSWSLDKRNKAERKSNYIGGFSTSTTKYDESKYISMSWDSIPENDINAINGYENYTELAAIVTTAITVTTSPTAVRVNNFVTIPSGSKVYLIRNGVATLLVTGTQSVGTLQLTASSNIALVKGDNIRLYNSSLSGLLTLASLSASGQTHTLRDFTGKLVRVILNSPKYEAIAGTDKRGQMYLSTRMDMDIVADMGGYVYKTTQAIKGSTYNEKLPTTSSVSATPGTASVTSLYLKNENRFGIISRSDTKGYDIEALLPFKPRPYFFGGLIDGLFSSFLVFGDYIASDNNLPKEMLVGTTIVKSDKDPLVSITFSELPDIYIMGEYSASFEYGKWDNITATTSYVVPQGGIVKESSTNKLFMSLIADNNKAFTDTTAWVDVTGKKIGVRYKGKFFEYVKESKGVLPADPAPADPAWKPFVFKPTTIKLNIKPALHAKVKESLFLVVSPLVLESDTTPAQVFTNTTMMRVPILQEAFTHAVELTSSDTCLKLASTDFNNKEYIVTAMDNTIKKPLPIDTVFIEHQGFKINGLKVKSGSTATLTASTESTMFNVNMLKEDTGHRIVTYAIVNNDPGITKVGIGTFNLSLSGGVVTMHYTDGSTSYKKTFTSYTTTTLTSTEVIRVFNALDFTKTVYEMIYSHANNTVQVNVYSMALDPEYKTVILTDRGKIDTEATGFKVIRTKKTYTFTGGTTTSTITQTLNLSMQSVNNTVYSPSNTYATLPVKDSVIMALFGLEGDVWV